MSSVLLVGLVYELRSALSRALELHGHTVAAANDVPSALHLLQGLAQALAIADADSPGFDPLYLSHALRATPGGKDSLLMLVSSRQSLQDKLSGFAAGADDYVTVPCQMAQLMLRVQALLRRAGPATKKAQEPTCFLRYGPITLNKQTGEMWLSGKSVSLTPVETRLLIYLVTSAGRPVSAEELLSQVWEQAPGEGNPVLVRVHVSNLRAKLEPAPTAPKLLRTVSRLGYCLALEGAA